MTARPDTHPFNSDQSSALLRRASKQWDDEIVPQLIEYVKLPAKSPSFEAEWKRAGQIQRAIDQAQNRRPELICNANLAQFGFHQLAVID